MKADPVIDMVREVRHRISAECGHDPRKVVEYYMELQKQYQQPLPGKAENETDGSHIAAPVISKS